MILARKAPVAAVFRRGPSKQVLLLKWDLRRDTLREGQWLKGHIYERRCDLSPSGELLVYFAASWKKPYGSWTAVSRLPWLTALALWPKGDAWGGGALFETEYDLLLNHPPFQREVAVGDARRLRLRALPRAGAGEDFPIEQQRRERDGWTLANPGRIEFRFGDFVVREPRVWRKRGLEERLVGLRDRNGPWYRLEYFREGEPLGELDWADFGPGGALLSARGGRLFRDGAEVADLRGLRFEPREAPRSARRW